MIIVDAFLASSGELFSKVFYFFKGVIIDDRKGRKLNGGLRNIP